MEGTKETECLAVSRPIMNENTGEISVVELHRPISVEWKICDFFSKLSVNDSATNSILSSPNYGIHANTFYNVLHTNYKRLFDSYNSWLYLEVVLKDHGKNVFSGAVEYFIGKIGIKKDDGSVYKSMERVQFLNNFRMVDRFQIVIVRMSELLENKNEIASSDDLTVFIEFDSHIFKQKSVILGQSLEAKLINTDTKSKAVSQVMENEKLQRNWTACSGTFIKFKAVIGSDEYISTKHQCITLMVAYLNKSLEELRLEDYVAKRKGRSFVIPKVKQKAACGTNPRSRKISSSVDPVISFGEKTSAFQSPFTFSFATSSSGSTTSSVDSVRSFGGNTSIFGSSIFGCATNPWSKKSSSGVDPVISFGEKTSSFPSPSTFHFGAKRLPETGAFSTTHVEDCGEKALDLKRPSSFSFGAKFSLASNFSPIPVNVEKSSEVGQLICESAKLEECDITCETEMSEKNVPLKAQRALLKKLEDMFLNELLCDLTIKVGGKDFHVHKCMLAAQSPWFANKIQNASEENELSSITIDGWDPDVFQLFLHYLYTAEIDKLSIENALSLYAIAHEYGVEELKQYCISYISKNFSVEHFCDIIELAVKHSELDLLNSSKLYFKNNAKKIIQTEKWFSCMKGNPTLATELLLLVMPN